MTFRELLEELQGLSPCQLAQPAVVYQEDYDAVWLLDSFDFDEGDEHQPPAVSITWTRVKADG